MIVKHLVRRGSRMLPLLLCILFLDGLSSQALALTNSPPTYRNPLINMDMADPHVIRVDGLYYLYATTHGRGYDVYTSVDLVSWTNRGSVYSDSRGGFWAPDVFRDIHGDGRYYLYYTANEHKPTNSRPEKVVGVAVAESPMGPFKDEGVLARVAIDGHMYEDGGKYYFYYVDLQGGFKIMVQPMANPTKKAGKAEKIIWPTQDWEMMHHRVTEGPFVLKRGSTYYLTYSGTATDSPNYALGFATASSPMGPFKKHEGNPFASRTQTVLGPGHHSIVEGPDAKLWLVYHQKWTEDISYKRFLAIDPIWFDAKGALRSDLSRDVDRPAPVPLKPVRR